MTFTASPILHLAGWYVLALAVSAALVPVCRSLALRYGYVARPRDDRWHRRPTALLGGIAIAATVFLLAPLGGGLRELAVPLAAGLLMFVVGVTDDLLSLKPSTKLIAQIALAAVLVISGERLHWTESLTVDTLLTMVWLVGITNAFNLLDNMDGLCAGVALIAGVSLLVGLFSNSGLTADVRYLAILLGATSGFLVYNAYPASIFMGDGGSLFLGFTLAAVTLSAGGPAHDRGNVLSIIIAPVLVVLIPIFDTTLVTVSRLVSGRRVSQGGLDHSSHRLVAIGLSERAAVGVLWTLAAAGGGLGLLARRFGDGSSALLAAVFILCMVVFAAYLAHVRVYDEPAAVPAQGVTPVVVQFMYKRRVAEVLLDVCLVTIAYYAAWRLRFDGIEWSIYFERFLESLPMAVAVQLVMLFIVGAYRGAWKYFGLMDGVVFARGVASGTLALVAAVAFLYRFEHYSRGVFVIYAALLMLMLCGSRASFRLIGEFVRRRRSGTRLMIYGAGEAGALVLRELLGDTTECYQMIGFIDDDPAKQNLRLHGYAVLGGQQVLVRMIETRSLDVVVISSRDFEGERLQQLEEACEASDVRLLRFLFRLEALVPSA